MSGPVVNQRMPIDDYNKEKVLGVLEAISVIYQRTLVFFQQASYLDSHNPKMIEHIEQYFAWILTLYKMLKPKLRTMKDTNDKDYQNFKPLEDLDNFEALAISETLNLTHYRETFFTFKKNEDLLRLLCEHLGYTGDPE